MSHTASSGNWRQSSGRSVQTNQKPADNPFKLVAGIAEKVGHELRFRVLTLDPAFTRTVYIVKPKKFVQKLNKSIEIAIHKALVYEDPEIEIKVNDLSGFTEPDTGDNLETLQANTLYRIPVWAYEVSDNKTGKVLQEIGKPMFLELTWAQYRDLRALENTRNVDFTFDEKMAKPMYDTIIVRNAEQGKDTYKIEGLSSYMEGKTMKPDPNYMVSDEEALGDAVIKQIDDAWEELQEAMNEFMEEKEIRFKLSDSAAARGGIATRPTMPGATTEEAPTVEDQKPQVAEESAQPQTRGRGRTSSPATADPTPPSETADSTTREYGQLRRERSRTPQAA